MSDMNEDTPLPDVTSRAQFQSRYWNLLVDEIAALKEALPALVNPLTPNPGALPEQQIVLIVNGDKSILWPLYYENGSVAGAKGVSYEKFRGVGTSVTNYGVDNHVIQEFFTLAHGSPDKIRALIERLRAATAWAIEQAAWRRAESERIKEEKRREEERVTRAVMERERESVRFLEAALAYRALAKGRGA